MRKKYLGQIVTETQSAEFRLKKTMPIYRSLLERWLREIRIRFGHVPLYYVFWCCVFRRFEKFISFMQVHL